MRILPAIVLFALALSAPCHAASVDERELLWRASVGGSQKDGSPAIANDGTIYTTSSGSSRYSEPFGGVLTALSPGGTEKWKFETFSAIKSSPAIGADGTIYFGCRDKKFYAISPQGKLKWSFATTAWIDSSAAIGTNGAVYFGGWDGNFYALNPDGTKKWVFPTHGIVDSSPAIGADGTIYFGSHDSNFYALNPDGSKKWAFATGGGIISSPAINREGVIYFGSLDGRLYALNPDGTEKWRLWTGGVGENSPVIGVEGNLYLNANGFFRAISPEGKALWANHNEGGHAGAALADGSAFFVCKDSQVLCGFSTNGAFIYTAQLGNGASAAPKIGPDGTIYLAAGIIVCTIKGTSPPAPSGWPMFRGNLLQNGRVGP